MPQSWRATLSRFFFLGLVLSPGAASAATQAAPQAALDSFAKDLGYRFTVLSNKTTDGCPDKPVQQYCFSARLDLTMPKTLPSGDWSLYLSFAENVLPLRSDAFTMTGINGSLHRIAPKPGMVKPGAAYQLNFIGPTHFFSPYILLPNVYVAQEGLKPRIIAATKPKLDPDSHLEELPFITPFTDEAQLATQRPDDATVWLTPQRLFEQDVQRHVDAGAPEFIILPTPAKAAHLEGPAIGLADGVHLVLHGIRAGDIAPALAAFKRTMPVGKSGAELSITADAAMTPESYRITARNGAIAITCADAAGASYALRSLAQQVAYEKLHLKPLEIEDAPRFAFRGLMMDLGRNFQPKAHILTIIEQMAAVKLNKLHLHLGDDEGWRLQIDGLPELTEIGARRCHDPAETSCQMPHLGSGPDAIAPGTGHFTSADYIEILKAAKARQIEVIPSFDMPGHSRAAIKSMKARALRLIAEGKPDEAARYRLDEPEDRTVYSSVQHYNDNTLNVCLPSTYAFIGTVIDSIKAMHQQAGLPLRIYHIGADETAGAWKDSPACQKFMADQHVTVQQLGNVFLTRVAAILRDKGIEPAGWSDGLSSLDPAQVPAKMQSNSWGNILGSGIAEAYRHANQGWDVVMSSPETLYFDMPYAADGWERGTDWATRVNDLYKVFAFMPENLGANAVVMVNGRGRGVSIADTVPLADGRHITGMQGQLWSETVRSPQIADYMLFPRTLALAEHAWHKASWEPDYVAGKSYAYGDGSVDTKALLADWNGFQAKLLPRLADLDRARIAYRIPVPGARVSGGMLEANAPIAGLKIQYRAGAAPWRTYSGPVAVNGPVTLRTLSPDGKRVSRSISVN
ncbi:MAG TPA: family 20 glycosylhydrolase [Rhizomicrobium sp.]|nr:family 20 glycosylhydrolase [Rhizomicrobium sp.]